jgi:hypothetical protein
MSAPRLVVTAHWSFFNLALAESYVAHLHKTLRHAGPKKLNELADSLQNSK